MNDRITGQCAIHLLPGPGGAPTPSPAPLPFSAPLTTGLARDVYIEGKPAAVERSGGSNTPPHPGLHASDPYLVPATQAARVLRGSSSVLIGGKGAAYSGCQVVTCANLPGQVTGTATSVRIGP